MAPNPPPSLSSSAKPPSRRASTANFVAPASSKVSKKAPTKPVRKNVGKKPAEPSETPKENSFVAGDLFDFNGQTMLTPAKSPKGPMTRARRSSMYVAPMKNGMVTSTARRRSVTKKLKEANLDSIMETPATEESYVGTELKIKTIVESPEGEISFKVDTMTPQMIDQKNHLLAKKEGVSPSRVILSPMALSPIKRVSRDKVEDKPTEPLEAKDIATEKSSEKETSIITSNMTPQMIEQQNRILAKKENKKMTKLQERPAVVTKPQIPEKLASNRPSSPIKKVQEKPSNAKQIVTKSPKKKASHLPLPKLTIPKKIIKAQKENIPGTPQPTNPGNLLKKNLKRKVDVRMDKKLDEIPKNLSPYTLIVGETENGSPVEQFIKTKPSKENITGTPAPTSKLRQNRILQPLDLGNIIANDAEGASYSFRKSPRLLATPKKLNMSNGEGLKNDTPKNVEDTEIPQKTPKLETENQAVNKALAKQKSELVSSRSCNSTTANSGGQLITGDLASLCLIM